MIWNDVKCQTAWVVAIYPVIQSYVDSGDPKNHGKIWKNHRGVLRLQVATPNHITVNCRVTNAVKQTALKLWTSVNSFQPLNPGTSCYTLPRSKPVRVIFSMKPSVIWWIWPNGIIFHQPRFPWNKGISLTEPPFRVRSCEVAIIWPDGFCKFDMGLPAFAEKKNAIPITEPSELFFFEFFGAWAVQSEQSNADSRNDSNLAFVLPNHTVNHHKPKQIYNTKYKIIKEAHVTCCK